VALLFVDLHVHLYGASAADEHNRAYDALRAAPPGRLLELPVFFPDLHYGSVYVYYDMRARRERPAGYSSVAPRVAYQPLTELVSANCGRLGGGQLATLHRLGVRYLAVHRALFRFRRQQRQSCTPPPPGLRIRMLPRLARDHGVTMYKLP
jgi:hypothetical protein